MLVIACLLLIAIVLMTIYISYQSPTAIDQFIIEMMNSMESAGGASVWKTIAFFGESSMIIAQALLLTIIAAFIVGFRKSLWVIAGVAATYAVNVAIKTAIARPRPEEAWGIEVSGFSFPSANAMLAVALYGMFAILIWKYSRLGLKVKGTIVSLAILLIILVGWSRLYFTVHYVTDIITGYFISGLVLIVAVIIQRKIARK